MEKMIRMLCLAFAALVLFGAQGMQMPALPESTEAKPSLNHWREQLGKAVEL